MLTVYYWVKISLLKPYHNIVNGIQITKISDAIDIAPKLLKATSNVGIKAKTKDIYLLLVFGNKAIADTSIKISNENIKYIHAKTTNTTGNLVDIGETKAVIVAKIKQKNVSNAKFLFIVNYFSSSLFIIEYPPIMAGIHQQQKA